MINEHLKYFRSVRMMNQSPGRAGVADKYLESYDANYSAYTVGITSGEVVDFYNKHSSTYNSVSSIGDMLHSLYKTGNSCQSKIQNSIYPCSICPNGHLTHSLYDFYVHF